MNNGHTEAHCSQLRQRIFPNRIIECTFSERLNHLAITFEGILSVSQSPDNLHIVVVLPIFFITPKSYVIKLTSIIMNFMHTSYSEMCCNFPPFLRRLCARTVCLKPSARAASFRVCLA